VPRPAQEVEHRSEVLGVEGSTWADGRPVRPAGALRDIERPGRSPRSVLPLKADSEVGDPLARIMEQEQLAVVGVLHRWSSARDDVARLEEALTIATEPDPR
jgi:hypothetical protein